MATTPRGRPFKPGTSGNPGGRPRGARLFRRMISEATDDGRELVDLALAFARDPNGRPADRIRVIEFLIDRLLGRSARHPVLASKTQAVSPANDESDMDLSRLTPEERERLIALTELCLVQRAQGS